MNALNEQNPETNHPVKNCGKDDGGAVRPLAGVIKNVFEELSTTPKHKKARLIASWEKLAGPKVAAVATPRFRQTTVVVWVQDSAMAYELSQRYGGAILKRLQNEFGEEEVKKIWFQAGVPGGE